MIGKNKTLNFFLNNIRFIHQIQMFDITVLVQFTLLQKAFRRQIQQIAQITFYLTSHSQTLYCLIILSRKLALQKQSCLNNKKL